MVAYNTALSTPIPMASGVPQGSVLGPFLYALFTADAPQHDSTVLSNFADDTAILSRHAHINEAISNLQTHLHSIEEWSRQWRLKNKREQIQTCDVHAPERKHPTTPF